MKIKKITRIFSMLVETDEGTFEVYPYDDYIEKFNFREGEYDEVEPGELLVGDRMVLLNMATHYLETDGFKSKTFSDD